MNPLKTRIYNLSLIVNIGFWSLVALFFLFGNQGGLGGNLGLKLVILMAPLTFITFWLGLKKRNLYLHYISLPFYLFNALICFLTSLTFFSIIAGLLSVSALVSAFVNWEGLEKVNHKELNPVS
jgi:hypothetical protein